MIYLMRHGLDNENYIGGWSDVPLTKEGIMQVKSTGDAIKQNENIKIAKIISSDVKRATQTAEIISSILGFTDFETTDFLREQSKGRLNGMEKSVAMSLYPEYFEGVNADTVYPDGECLRDLYLKIKNNLEYFSDLDDTLIITHRGVINMLYYILNDIPLDMDKEKFLVEHASLHECDILNKMIRKVK